MLLGSLFLLRAVPLATCLGAASLRIVAWGGYAACPPAPPAGSLPGEYGASLQHCQLACMGTHENPQRPAPHPVQASNAPDTDSDLEDFDEASQPGFKRFRSLQQPALPEAARERPMQRPMQQPQQQVGCPPPEQGPACSSHFTGGGRCPLLHSSQAWLRC